MTAASPAHVPVLTLVGAGPVDPADLARCLALAPDLVAADGGAATALRHGHVPTLVLGDFDSLPPDIAARLPPERLRQVACQDSTDFEKCLAAISADLVLGLGFLGGRIDHSLAAMTALVRDRRRIVLLGSEDVVLAVPDRLALGLDPGCRVSLFPLAPVTGRSTGLRWPIDGIAFAADGRIGTSNAATGPVTIRMDGPGMVLVMPRAALGAVLDAWMPAPRAR